MSSLNKVILIGRLGQDPELKSTSNGRNVCSFSLATSESFNNQMGERQERTEWHKIVVWDKQAETSSRYLQKGRLVCIEGRLRTRDWMDKNNQKRYTTEINADRVTFLGGRNEGSFQNQAGGSGGFNQSSNYGNQNNSYGNQQTPNFNEAQNQEAAPAQAANPPGEFLEDDDLPF